MASGVAPSMRAEPGFMEWAGRLERLAASPGTIRRTFDLIGEREVKRTGDGFLATFDGPARAIRSAASVAEAMGTLVLQIRAGLHTGELEVMDGDLSGLARAHSLARAGSRRAERGARVRDGEGPDGRLGHRIRGTRRARAPRSAGRVAPVRGRLNRLGAGPTATLSP